MSKRYPAGLLLSAALFSAALWSWGPTLSATNPESAAAGITDATNRRDAGAAADAAANRPPLVLPAPSRVVAATLSTEQAAAVAETVALQQRAAECGLSLSPEQWMALGAVSSHHQAIRHAYEASVARATHVAAGQARIEIPAYPVAGDALRAGFYDALRAQLGPAATQEVARCLGSALEGHFAGFGVSVQTLDIFAAPAAAETDYQVMRTIKYWNSAEASDRLITRREVHFPGLEDPSGHHWGPFLSVLVARNPAGAGS